MGNIVAYAILQIQVSDPVAYKRYALAGHLELLDKFDGRLTVIDGEPDVVEGEWPYNRTVVMEFPDKARALAWYRSPAYQEMVGLRHAASTANCAIVGGLPDIFIR